MVEQVLRQQRPGPAAEDANQVQPGLTGSPAVTDRSQLVFPVENDRQQAQGSYPVKDSIGQPAQVRGSSDGADKTRREYQVQE